MTDPDAVGAVLYASHTHLFPGAKLRGPRPDDPDALPVLIVFSDAPSADAVLTASGHDGEGYGLDVAPYRTASGTEIGAKGWVLEPRPGGWDYAVTATAG